MLVIKSGELKFAREVIRAGSATGNFEPIPNATKFRRKSPIFRACGQPEGVSKGEQVRAAVLPDMLIAQAVTGVANRRGFTRKKGDDAAAFALRPGSKNNFGRIHISSTVS